MSRAGKLRRLIPGLVVMGLLVGACATGGGGRTGFVARGSPRPLPAGGTLLPASAGEFQGMVVAQRGRPVVVNVWASWCGPCRTEAPVLQRAFAQYRNRVSFLGVATSDQADDARSFMKRYGLRYPNLLDETGRIKAVLGVPGLPTTLVFDRDGKVVASVLGGVSEQKLVALLEDALRP